MPTANETRSRRNKSDRDSIEKFLRKRKAEGSAPDAAPLANTRKQVRELKLRSLLRLRETDTPSLLETAKAERVINLEEAIGREGEKTKSSLEKQLKDALADLNNEIKKRPSYEGPTVEINKESPIDVDETDGKFAMEIETPTEDEDKEPGTKEEVSWAKICESDEDKSDSESPSIDAMMNEDITGSDSKKNQDNETNQDKEKSRTQDKTRNNPNTEKGSKEGKSDKEKVSKGKEEKKIHNPYQAPKTKPQGENAWKDGKKSVEMVSKGVETEGKNPFFIRIRTQFEMKQTSLGHIAHQIETKRVMDEFVQVLKKVEESANIAKWEGGTKVCKEFGSLSPSEVNKYVDVPPWARKSYGVKRQFRFGIRINTTLPLHQFMGLWGRFKQTEGWTHISESEMQESPTWNAVGWLQGSSNRQCLKTINKWLKEEFGDKNAEASFQNIRDVGDPKLIREMWDEAKKAAEQKGANMKSNFNTIKQQLAPSGVVIYCSREQHVKELKASLMKEYGKEKDNRMPVWKNGSQYKFVPSISNKSKKSNKHTVSKRLKWHCWSKSNEVRIPIEVIDIFDEKDYLKGKSLEYIINTWTSSKHLNEALVKDVARKWDRDHTKEKYELVVYARYAEEADEKVKAMKSDLGDLYSEEVLQHFPNQSLLTSFSHSAHYRQIEQEEIEDEIEDMLSEETGLTEHERILAPDFRFIIEADNMQPNGGDTTIGLTTTASLEQSTLDTQKDGSSIGGWTSVSSSTRASSRGSTSISWDPSVNGDKNSSDYRESKKVQKILTKAGISSTQFHTWKEDNPDMVETYSKGANGKKYPVAYLIANYMVGEKEKLITQDNQKKPEEQLDPNAPKGP